MPDKIAPMALKSALIFGAGNGLSAALARRFAQEGFKVGLVARQPDKLAALAQSVNALSLQGDVSEPDEVARVFAEFDAKHGVPDIVVFNPWDGYWCFLFTGGGSEIAGPWIANGNRRVPVAGEFRP